MTLLIDIFGFLTVVTHGLTIFTQSMALGGVLFTVFLARPLLQDLGPAGHDILRRAQRIAAWSAVGLIACEAITITLQGAVLVGTVDIGWAEVLTAEFAVAGLIKCAGALVIVLLLSMFGERPPRTGLLLAVLIVLAAATLTTHANARLEHQLPLLLVSGLHQLGAAIWIGGLPSFIMALAYCHDGRQWRLVGKRFSQMSMVGVACIIVSGTVLFALYVGSLKGFYGTAYGVMVGAKIAMFLGLMALGAGNYLLVERLRRNPATPVTRLKRFAEVELAVGFAIFFAAASLTSSPPSVDLKSDRVTWAEIVERNTPHWPRLESPSHEDLFQSIAQEKLDEEATRQAKAPPVAFVPGSGIIAPRNAEDIAWSEYNHHWAGLFVLLIGFLALLNQGGVGWARHWPLVFFGLALFLFLRSDPEVWPLGKEGFWVSFRDVEVVQHRIAVLLTVAFGIFEWRVRTGSLKAAWASYVFPIICAAGGILLLTHQHAIANVKEQLLIELTHTPLALAAIAAGAFRWLELRLDPPSNRVAGWLWPICFLVIGAFLVLYREA